MNDRSSIYIYFNSLIFGYFTEIRDKDKNTFINHENASLQV